MNEKYETKSIEEMQKSVWAALDRIGERLDRQSQEAELRVKEWDVVLKKMESERKERQVQLEKERIERQAQFDKERIEQQAQLDKERIKRLTERETERKELQAKWETERKELQTKWDTERKERQAQLDSERKERLSEWEAEAKKRHAEYEKEIKNFKDKSGVYSESVGAFAEDYFYNSFEAGKLNFFGEKFEIIRKRVKGIKKDDEYDILLVNGRIIGIIEVKFKAHEKDIPNTQKKAETFRENFPEYQNHKVYLALASMSFYPEVEELCKENGIAIIKQVGDTVVIYDEHLKVY